jgi:hypothetical protein
LLTSLWAWALTNAPDGDLSGLDPEEIEEACDWFGEKGDLFDALIEMRLLDRNVTNPKEKVMDSSRRIRKGELKLDPNVTEYEPKRDQILIHNWLERGGSYAENRRKQLIRQRKKNVPGLSRDCPGAVPEMSGTVPEMSALEEKRREEKRKEKKHYVAYERHVEKVKIVWSHYRTYHSKTPKELKPKRKEYRLLADRLDDFDGDVEPLKQAIDGYHRSPFHLGQNERQKTYLSLELIMRDISHVQTGIEFVKSSVAKNRTREIDDSILMCDRGDANHGE